MDVQLAVDVFHVGGHGLLADGDFDGHFGAAVAGGDQAQNLHLTLRQLFVVVVNQRTAMKAVELGVVYLC